MVSTIILSPQHNENIPHTNTDFNVVIAVDNLDTGHFTNPNTTYYSAPQQLNNDGVIIGHTHITIQVYHSGELPSLISGFGSFLESISTSRCIPIRFFLRSEFGGEGR
jgi:hypothetical protein